MTRHRLHPVTAVVAVALLALTVLAVPGGATPPDGAEPAMLPERYTAVLVADPRVYLIDTGTNDGNEFTAGNTPVSVAVTPDGTTAYVTQALVDLFQQPPLLSRLLPVDLVTGAPGEPIPVAGTTLGGIAITPDGATAYVTRPLATSIQPVDLATGTPGTPIPPTGPSSAFNRPTAIAITPDGTTAYVTNELGDSVTPVALASATPGTPIAVGDQPGAIAITPDGSTAYVANVADDTVTPIDLATDTPGTPITVGDQPMDLAITPDGATAYVAEFGDDTVTPIDLATDTPGTPITVDPGPVTAAVSPDGANVYVGLRTHGAVIQIATATDMVVGDGIGIGGNIVDLEIAPVCPGHPFTDVRPWVVDAVDWAWCRVLMSGYNDGTFRADLPISRAQVANLLYRAAGSPPVDALPAHPWSDIPAWIEDAARWLAGNDYATGFDDGTFRPRDDITRGQVARMQYRIAGEPTGSPPNPFTDVGAWVDDAVDWLVDPANVPPYATGFDDNTFRPGADITRGQTARMTCRINSPGGTC